jgi:hypothetical protein
MHGKKDVEGVVGYLIMDAVNVMMSRSYYIVYGVWIGNSRMLSEVAMRALDAYISAGARKRTQRH